MNWVIYPSTTRNDPSYGQPCGSELPMQNPIMQPPCPKSRWILPFWLC